MFKKTLVLASLIGASFAAQAVTVDLRHEYTDTGAKGANKDRVSVSHRFANGLGFSVEAKWASAGDNGDRPLTDMVGSGHESSLSWRWKANKNISLTPGFNIDSGSSTTTYKPYLHAQYSFDNGFYVAARYRYEYTRVPADSNKPANDNKVNRGDAWVGYVFGDWRTELNYVYARSEVADSSSINKGYYRNNNKPWGYEYNAKLAYKWDKNWAPYIEVGNVGNKNTDERQTRYRAGVAYSF